MEAEANTEEQVVTNNDVLVEDAAADAARRFAPPEDASRTWRMPTDQPKYRPYLADLMNFFEDPKTPYTKDTVFTKEQLLRLNPTVVKRWMAKKAYGKEEYDRKNDKPRCSSATSEMMKKAVSYFMPNKNVAWVNGAGNPTRHQYIREVIADMKKAEARQQGANKSSARRASNEAGDNGASAEAPAAGAGGGGGVVAAAAAGNASVHDMLQSIQMSIQQLQQQIHNVAARTDANHAELRAHIQRSDQILFNNIRAFGGTIEGGFQLQQANNNAGRRPLPLAVGANNANGGPTVDVANNNNKAATLSGNPTSLNELWQEYEHGLDGRKPARNFTARERNSSRQIKQKFYRRKNVWDTIRRLVAYGHTVEAAIERIKQVYGENVSVTRVINGIIRDKKEYGGPHPNLA